LPPGLVRMSVGIEDLEDLWSDLDAALRTSPE
jgi:cystathionine beta-lyase/cystathionine gamma-synthase